MLFGTDCGDVGDIPPQYCTIPVLSCIVKAYTTLRMCRVLLASAFDLVNPAFSRGRGARRKRDPSMQPHSDIRCVMIRACYVRKLNRRIPFYWMVGTRLDAHYRLRGGLFLPICEPSALLQAAYAIICHVRCVCVQPVSARDRLEAAAGRICTCYHVKSPRSKRDYPARMFRACS